jgi:hydrogenase maturation protease
MRRGRWSTACAVANEPVKAPVVIFACGNPSRGDDALGPWLLDHLQDWLAAEGLADGFELIGDFQLNIEHALDLAGRRLALFIDAGSGTPAPFVFREACAQAGATHSTHALSPEAVLAVVPQIGAEAPPPSFVLCVRGERFELGEGLSEAAQAHAGAALELLRRLCHRPEVEAWIAQAYNQKQ